MYLFNLAAVSAENLTNDLLSGLIFAICAVALSPLVYWIIGPAHGKREGGSNPLMRKFIVLVWGVCLVVAMLCAAQLR